MGYVWGIAFKEYSKAIDMWSVGCILAEMSESEAESFSGTPLVAQRFSVLRDSQRQADLPWKGLSSS